MKRGLLPLLIFLLLIPVAAAQTSVLDIFFGSSEESLLLLKFMYGALVFVIFYKVSKESVFKDTAGGTKNERFATAFSLILALLTMRFTPDVVVAGFGWVITLIAPFALFFAVSGMFIKKAGLTWLKVLLSLIATLLTLAALGSYKGFSTNIRGLPLGGGFLDELFSDLHYFFFYKLDWFWAMFIVAVVVYLIYYLVGRFGGGKTGEAGEGIGFGGGLLAVLGIGLLIALLGYFLGGGLGAIGGYGLVLLMLLLVALALWGAYKQKKRLLGAGEGVGGIIGWTFLDAIPMFLKGLGLILKAFLWDAPMTIINLLRGKKKEKKEEAREEKLGKSSIDITSPKKGDRFLPGETIKVRFLVKGIEPAVFAISLSENGKSEQSFQPLEEGGRRIVLNSTVRSFDFIAPDIESENCYVGIRAVDRTGRTLVFATSGKFAIGEEKEKGPSLWQRMKDKLKSKKPEGEEPEKKEGKLSVSITSPKEGDTFAAGSTIPVTFVAEGKKPASYLVQFSSSGTHAYNRKWDYVHAPGGRFTLGPDTTQFDLPAPMVHSDTCYLMLQAIDEKGKPIGSFVSERFSIRAVATGKPSVIITSPKEGDVFATSSTIRFAFTSQGPKPAAYAILFSSLGRDQKKFAYLEGALDPDAKEFPFEAPVEASEDCYIQIQPLDKKGKPLGFFTSGQFAVRQVRGQAPVQEEERPTSPMGQPLKPKIAGLIGPPVVLLSPRENEKIQAGKALQVAWRVEGFEGLIAANALLGYSMQGPNGQYTSIARIKMDGKVKVYFWDVPKLPEGTVYFRIYIGEIGADRVFGPFPIAGEESSVVERIKNLFTGEPKEAAVAQEAETQTEPGTRILAEVEREEIPTAPGTTQPGEGEEDTVGQTIVPGVEEETTEPKTIPLIKRVEKPDIILLSPVELEIITTPTIEISWQFVNVEKDFATDLRIVMNAGEEKEIRDVKSGMNHTIRWKVPDMEKNTDLYITFIIDGGLQKKFGPFTIKGKETAELSESLDIIVASLENIKLPAKLRRLKKVDVGTFLYYLISSKELASYINAANRFREIEYELKVPRVQNKIGKLYREYMNQLAAIEEIRKSLYGLEHNNEVRARLIYLLDLILTQIREDASGRYTALLTDFRKHFGVELKKGFRGNVIVSNIEYLAWFMERAQKLDEILGAGESEGGLRALYRYTEALMEYTERMYSELQNARDILKKIKKQLKTQ